MKRAVLSCTGARAADYELVSTGGLLSKVGLDLTPPMEVTRGFYLVGEGEGSSNKGRQAVIDSKSGRQYMCDPCYVLNVRDGFRMGTIFDAITFKLPGSLKTTIR